MHVPRFQRAVFVSSWAVSLPYLADILVELTAIRPATQLIVPIATHIAAPATALLVPTMEHCSVTMCAFAQMGGRVRGAKPKLPVDFEAALTSLSLVVQLFVCALVTSWDRAANFAVAKTVADAMLKQVHASAPQDMLAPYVRRA